MDKFNPILRCGCGLLLVLALGFANATTKIALAGGWGVVTIDAMPDVIVAGQRAEFRLSIRQHGRELLSDIAPELRFINRDGDRSTATAQASEQTGQYVVTVTFPSAGVWSWELTSFPATQLGAFAVVEPRQAISARYSVARALRTINGQHARGRQLFQSKGCYTCHAHADVATSGQFSRAYGNDGGAPDLSQPKWTDAYLRAWLADPAQVKPGARMPNLNLTSKEILWLSVFLRDEHTGRKSGSPR